MDIATLTAHPLFNLGNGVIGFVGVVLAFYFYFKGKERFALSYTVVEKMLIQPSTKLPFDLDVPLSWNGKQLTRLTRTYILLKNTGNKLIERADIVGVPAVNVAASSQIIEADVVFSDDPGSQALINSGVTSARSFDFVFLRPSDAFIIRVDHTGALNELFVDCKTKAGGPIKKTNQTVRVFFGSVVGIILAIGLGNFIWRNSEFPEFLQYNSPYNADLFSTFLGSLLLGGISILVVIFTAAGLASLTTYLRRGSRKEVKRAWVVFTEISSNSKNAVSQLHK